MNLSRRQFVRAAGAIALGLAGSGALAGCGSTGLGSTSGSESSKLATIKDRGTLNCGVKKDIPGYGYLDPATGKYRGMEIDLCYQVAAKVFGCSYEQAKSDDLVAFTDVTPKTRGPLIDNDQLDMICATYTITDERKQSWDFTRAYRSDYIGLLVKKGKFKGLRDLDGKYIGVSQGSSTKQAIQDMLKDKGLDVSPTFLQFPDYSTLKIALDSGNIDVFSVDRSILGGYKDDTTELLEPDVKFGKQEYGIATKKGCDFSSTCDQVVAECLSNGWLDQEVKDWNLL